MRKEGEAKDGARRGDSGPAMRRVVERRLERGGSTGGEAVLAFWQDVASRLHERGRVDAESCLLLGRGDVAGVLATLTAGLVAAVQDEEGWNARAAADWTADVVQSVRTWGRRPGARKREEVAAEHGGRVGGYRRLGEVRAGDVDALKRWQRSYECRFEYGLSWSSAALLLAIASYAGDRRMVCTMGREVLMKQACVGSKQVFAASMLVLEVLGLIVRCRQATGQTWWYLGEVFGGGVADVDADRAGAGRRIAYLAKEAAQGRRPALPTARGAAAGRAASDDEGYEVEAVAHARGGAVAEANAGGDVRGMTADASVDADARAAQAEGRTGSEPAVGARARGPSGSAEADAAARRECGSRANARGHGDAGADLRSFEGGSRGRASAAVADARADASERTAGRTAEVRTAAQAGEALSTGSGTDVDEGRTDGVGAVVDPDDSGGRALEPGALPDGREPWRQLTAAEFVAETVADHPEAAPYAEYLGSVLAQKLDREGQSRWPRARLAAYAVPVLRGAMERAALKAQEQAVARARRVDEARRLAQERAEFAAAERDLRRREAEAPLCAVCGEKVFGLRGPRAVDGADLVPPREGTVCGLCVEGLESARRTK